MHRQQKATLVAGILCLSLLISCSRKPEDFIGVHTFYQGSKYVVIDSSNNIGTWYLKEYPKIETVRFIPVKIDVFKNGDQLAGTLSTELLQHEFKGVYFNTSMPIKKNLSNFHLVGDTLLFDVNFGNTFMGDLTKEFRLVKIEDEILMFEPKLNSDSSNIKCNKFVKSANEKYIIYSSSNNAKQELIKESNRCADQNAIKNVSAEYPIEKLPYLKELLSKY